MIYVLKKATLRLHVLKKATLRLQSHSISHEKLIRQNFWLASRLIFLGFSSAPQLLLHVAFSVYVYGYTLLTRVKFFYYNDVTFIDEMH